MTLYYLPPPPKKRMVNTTTPKLKMELKTELFTKEISFYSNHNFQGQRSIQLPNSQTSSNISAPPLAIQNPAAVPLANIHNIPWITGFVLIFNSPKWSKIRFLRIILLMERIRRSPVEVGRLSHYLQDFVHPRWCWISSIV